MRTKRRATAEEKGFRQGAGASPQEKQHAGNRVPHFMRIGANSLERLNCPTAKIFVSQVNVNRCRSWIMLGPWTLFVMLLFYLFSCFHLILHYFQETYPVVF